jgi:hypothetical protein
MKNSIRYFKEERSSKYMKSLAVSSDPTSGEESSCEESKSSLIAKTGHVNIIATVEDPLSYIDPNADLNLAASQKNLADVGCLHLSTYISSLVIISYYSIMLGRQDTLSVSARPSSVR